MPIFEFDAANEETGDHFTLEVRGRDQLEAESRASDMGYMVGQLKKVTDTGGGDKSKPPTYPTIELLSSAFRVIGTIVGIIGALGTIVNLAIAAESDYPIDIIMDAIILAGTTVFAVIYLFATAQILIIIRDIAASLFYLRK